MIFLLILIPAILFFGYLLYWLIKQFLKSPEVEHHDPYVLQYEWNVSEAKYDFVLYKYDAWDDGWSLNVGYRVVGRGDKKWAKKQAKHYGLFDED